MCDPLAAKMEKMDTNQTPKKAKKDKKKKLKQKSEIDKSENEDKKVEVKGESENKSKKEDKAVTSEDIFDVSSLRQELLAENSFISKALSLVRVPKHKNQQSEQDSDADSENDEEAVVAGDSPAKGGGGRAANAGQLHQKLQAKLAELRGENFGKGKKKKKPKLSKAEKKAKAKLEKKLKAKLSKKLMNGGGGAEGSPRLGGSPASMSPNPHKPVYNSDGKMVFSKFDFANGEVVKGSQSGTAEKKPGPKPGPKDPKAALNKIKKHKEKLQSLEAIGKTNRVKSIEEKTAWSTALAKAEGTKVKDDVDLLKKSIKKMDQRKKKSKQKWDSRKEGEEKRKNFKQQKRSDNINKRKQDKKTKKAGFR